MKGRRQEEDGTNLNQADARTIRKWARQRNAKPATGRNSGTSTLIGEDESVESEDIEQKCIFEGIFEAQHLVLRNVETGDVSRVIPAPRNKCYDCLYCLRAGIIYGTRKLKGAKRHRAQCENNPNRKLHSAQYIYEYEQRPKKLKTSAENIIDPPAREKKREEGTDNTKYWVKLALKSWACRKCRKRGEPLKTWSSQGWVRNHWLKCKYNKRKGLTVPRPLPPSKRKLLNKNVRKLRGKRTLKVLDKYDQSNFAVSGNEYDTR